VVRELSCRESNILDERLIMRWEAEIWKRSTHSSMRSDILHFAKLRMNDFDSSCDISRISLTKESIRFEQLLAVLKYFSPLVLSYIFSKSCKEEVIPFKGFLNSCAAYANAIVLSFDKFFCFSNSIHFDISRIDTIRR
jgi:hypothetical protein